MAAPYTPAQEAQRRSWLGDFEVLEDMSWDPQCITVLRLRTARHRCDLVCNSSLLSHQQ